MFPGRGAILFSSSIAEVRRDGGSVLDDSDERFRDKVYKPLLRFTGVWIIEDIIQELRLVEVPEPWCCRNIPVSIIKLLDLIGGVSEVAASRRGGSTFV